MKKYDLSRKKPSALEKTRKLAEQNPNTIYGYFDLIQEEASRLNILQRPECFWNLDETNLCLDPSRTKVIAPKGKRASRITATSGREHVTVLAAVSAAGDKLPPFIVFKGKYILQNWHTQTPYPGTEVSRSESGWMTTEIFAAWFHRFCNHVTQRPLILVFDGHVSHVSLEIVRKAREENISIIKLPPHTTHRLQTLDKSCFGPLQKKWDKAVVTWNREHLFTRLSKSDFIHLVGTIWDDVFTTLNIQAGFRSAGLFPVNRKAYPEDVFDPEQLAVYKIKHPLEYAAPPTPKPATPRSIPPTRTTEAPLSSTANVKRALFQDQITGETVTGQEVCDASTEIIASEHETSNAIEDTIQLAATTTNPQASTSQLPTTSTPVSEKKSFIQLFSNTLMKRQDAAPKAGKPNRKHTHNQSVILTCDAILKDLEEPTTSEPKQKAKRSKKETTTKPATRQRSPSPANTTPPSSPEAMELDDSSSVDFDEDDFTDAASCFFNTSQYTRIKKHIKEHDYYAVDYNDTYYVGRVLKLNKNNVTMKFLTRLTDDKFDWPKRDDLDNVLPEGNLTSLLAN